MSTDCAQLLLARPTDLTLPDCGYDGEGGRGEVKEEEEALQEAAAVNCSTLKKVIAERSGGGEVHKNKTVRLEILI